MSLKKKLPLCDETKKLVRKVLIDLYENDRDESPQKSADETISAYDNRTMTVRQNEKILEVSALLEEIA